MTGFCGSCGDRPVYGRRTTSKRRRIARLIVPEVPVPCCDDDVVDISAPNTGDVVINPVDPIVPVPDPEPDPDPVGGTEEFTCDDPPSSLPENVRIPVDPDNTYLPMTYSDLEAASQAAITRLNEIRADPTEPYFADAGRAGPSGPLLWNANLAHAAMMHAADMVVRGYNIRHNAPTHPWGWKPSERYVNSLASGPTVVKQSENIGTTSSKNDYYAAHATAVDALSDIFLSWVNIWRGQFNDPAGSAYLTEGHHVNNMDIDHNIIGLGAVIFPPCMKVGPGWLDFAGNEANYALNPYNPIYRTDIFDGTTLTQFIWGRTFVVFALQGDTADPPGSAFAPPPALFDTVKINYDNPLPALSGGVTVEPPP